MVVASRVRSPVTGSRQSSMSMPVTTRPSPSSPSTNPIPSTSRASAAASAVRKSHHVEESLHEAGLPVHMSTGGLSHLPSPLVYDFHTHFHTTQRSSA